MFDKDKASKSLIQILAITILSSYIFAVLFYLSIDDFDGTRITENFYLAVSGMPVYGYTLLASQVLIFLCINRICVFLEADPERGSNETIMKAKKFSGAGCIFGILMLATFFLFMQARFDLIINEYVYNADSVKNQYMEIFDLKEDEAASLRDTHLIYAAVWVLIFGTFFIFGIVFTNFYFGRLLTYYSSQKGQRSKTIKRLIFQIIGIIWSINFLIGYVIPSLINLIIQGVITLFILIILVALSKENLREIQFKSTFTLSREKEAINKREYHFFRRIVQISMGMSILFIGILWFGSTYFYSRNKEWYDGGFYLVLGILILLIPATSLLYANRKTSQQVLKISLLIISLLSMFYLALAMFSYSELLTNYVFLIFFQSRVQTLSIAQGFWYKPGQYILLFLLFFSSMVSVVGLKKGFVPIRNPEKRSLKQLINIKRYAKPSKIFLLMLGLLIVSLVITYEGAGASIKLENDKEFCPKISFWEWDGDWTDHEEETLDKLAKYDMDLYGGYGYDEDYKVRMEKYYNRSIDVYATGDNHGWIEWIEEQNATGWNRCPVKGFIEDIEDGGQLYNYNRHRNERERAEYEELIDYVHQHDMKQHFTAMHTTINDQRDGDLDLSIFHQIHSFPPLDWDTWNWMIYRTEAATSYEEESPYFTYLWVKELKDTVNELYGNQYDEKLSISIGVTGEDRNLYSKDDGLEELIWDMRICDALKIPEVIIFILNPENGSNFLGLYGFKGLDKIAEEINDWDALNLPYSRSATLFGNIKYLENPTGSVFGNYWMDLFLDNGLIFFALAWMLIQTFFYALFIKEYLDKNLEPLKNH